MLSIFRCFGTSPSPSHGGNTQSQLQKYKDRTEKIRLDQSFMESGKDVMKFVLHKYPYVLTDDDYIDILKKLHRHAGPCISNALAASGFQTVSAYSLYPKSNARYKVQVLRVFFNEPWLSVDNEGAKNYNGNIVYCKRANAVDLDEQVKVDLFNQLLGEIRKVRISCGKLRSGTGGQQYFDLSDAAYRKILQQFYAKLSPEQKQEFERAGIKTVAKYSWYPDLRARFKVYALLDCWAPSGAKIGGKSCSIAYAQSRSIAFESQCDLQVSGNRFIRFLRDHFFPAGQKSGYPGRRPVGAGGRAIDKSTFVDLNLPRFIEALSSIADASGKKKTIEFRLTSNEVLKITNDETGNGTVRLTLCNKSDLRLYRIIFEELTPQEIIHSLNGLPNVEKRREYLIRGTDRLMQRNFYEKISTN